MGQRLEIFVRVSGSDDDSLGILESDSRFNHRQTASLGGLVHQYEHLITLAGLHRLFERLT